MRREIDDEEIELKKVGHLIFLLSDLIRSLSRNVAKKKLEDLTSREVDDH